MLIKRPDDINPSEITSETIYRERRRFLAIAATGIASIAAGGLALSATEAKPLPAAKQLPNLGHSPYSTTEVRNTFEEITTYNNFYEFGTSKSDPAKYADALITSPWEVMVDGEVAKPGKFSFEDLIKPYPLEERIYRMRCVEGWSMVIPWDGFPLGALLKRFEPTSRAKFVQFTTLYDPQQMWGQKSHVLDWPYVEGLRIDEAMHPLTILAVGLYGQVLPNQNGAPLRLVVPWKYGFKSIKSIVRISLLEKMPVTTWAHTNPREYGFYSNVNPAVDHPRWSQKKERRIGEFTKRATLPFNGYGKEVAHLYSGMDLKKYF